MKIKEVIVVEGKHDTTKIQQAVDADTIETNGSAVNKTTLDMISHARKKRGIIIFTDPDYPGERIRHVINERVPGCKQAFLPKQQAESKQVKRSVGIEHASKEAIQSSLAQVYEVYETVPSEKQIRKQDLIPYGLVAGQGSKARRKALGEYLHIGHTNGKQLVKRLNMFHISKEELNSAMVHLEEEGVCS
ncbi:MAG TPA: ribonuclease M5 [Pseudogracilibacillus sp.]|nr:ribonuclease M5 [Pseudogracilibacillus sp.]